MISLGHKNTYIVKIRLSEIMPPTHMALRLLFMIKRSNVSLHVHDNSQQVFVITNIHQRLVCTHSIHFVILHCSLQQNSPAGVSVFTVGAIDDDGDSLTYSIHSGSQ